MAFPSRIIVELKKQVWHCEICHQYSAYLEGHSASGLHIVAKKVGSKTIYQVYDTTLGHKGLEGRTVSEKMAKLYIIVEGRDSDCLMVCPECHDELNRVALAEARLQDPDFEGNTPPVAILFGVTLTMYLRGKSMVVPVKI